MKPWSGALAGAEPLPAGAWRSVHLAPSSVSGCRPAPPTRRPLAKEMPEMGTHFLYGAVTELVRRLLRGRP